MQNLWAKSLSHMLFWASAAFFIDQATKMWALQACLIQPFSLPPFVCRVLFNEGISGSFFEGMPWVVAFLIALGLGVLIFLLFERVKKGKDIVPEAIVLGSAFSNIYDRFFYVGVVDFISMHLGAFESPTGNLADIFIILGILYMLVRNE